MNEVFVVTHGDYSDYGVECVFEREQDAAEYVRLSNLSDVRRCHDLWHRNAGASAYSFDQRQKHTAAFEECEQCQKELAQGSERYGSYRVERYAFHPAGEIPHGDASNTDTKP